LFTGDDVDKKIEVLSGGEKARVALAKLLLRPVNFLILDEPTNHLDIEACAVLEEAFRAYAGTLLFVSHDRTFINALATRVVEVEHGRIEEHLGNYDAYLERKERAERAQEAATVRNRSAKPESITAADSETPSATTHKELRIKQRELRKARDKTARRIEKLEAAITDHEERREALNWRLGEPKVYQDADLSRTLRVEQDEHSVQIDTLYSEWESLSEELAVLDAEIGA